MGRFFLVACFSYYICLAVAPELCFSCTLPSLCDVSIDKLNYLQSSGIVTSVDLVKVYTQRTSEVNDRLRAVTEINPDALVIAKVRDAERAHGFVRGPLHGIPILLKDNIATTDSQNTSAGSFALQGAQPKYEAIVVKKLRAAGAVILGKATMGEWAQFRSAFGSSSHGWSALHGQTLGAYHTQQDPHGSSSGSAVAVSVGLATLSLATETSGSIVNPAEKNNLVGIKPTMGLTSRDMVIPITLRQDSVGPIAQTVKDAAYMLAAISGKDKHDNWTLAQPFDVVPDYAKACNFNALNGTRLGVPRNGIAPFLDETTKPIMDAFERALRIMQNAGATVKDSTNFASFDKRKWDLNGEIVMDTDFASGLQGYLSKLKTNPNNLHSLQDLVHFTRNHPLEGLPDRDMHAWERSLKRQVDSNSDESRAAFQANLDMAEDEGIIGVLNRHNLDALVMPTFTAFHLTSIAGLPIITVPLGFYPKDTPVKMNLKGNLISVGPGIPFGLSFIGRKWSEETLISLAHAFEQKTMVRKQQEPLIKPSYELGSQIRDVARPSPSNLAIGAMSVKMEYRRPFMERLKAQFVSLSYALMTAGDLPGNPQSTAQVRQPSQALSGAAQAFRLAKTSSNDINAAKIQGKGAIYAASSAGAAGVRHPWNANGLTIAVSGSTGIHQRPLPSKHNSFQADRSKLDETILPSDTLRTPSPSHMAAQIAASRAIPSAGPKVPPHVINDRSQEGKSRLENKLDETSVPATKSLVQLYERKQDADVHRPVIQSVRYAKPPTTMASPMPVRPSARPMSSADVLSASLPKALARSTSASISTTHNTTSSGAVAVSLAKKQPAPKPPPPRRSQRTLSDATDEGAVVSRERSVQPIQTQRPKPDPPSTLRRHKTTTTLPTLPTAIRQTSPASPPIKPLPRSTSQSTLPPKPSPPLSRLSTETHLSPTSTNSYTPTLTVSSLANAMVASSLASSRATSPSKSPLPTPPPRRKASKSSLFHLHHSNPSNNSLISRTPSPTKPAGLARTTMRSEPAKAPKQAEFAGHLVRKPHHHHEGDRKRYRTELTERERKRYEGVWAANRGLLLPPPSSNIEALNGEVINLVVRDIWRRSKLPDVVLEEVWELVNLRGGRSLSREEFVVGLWLIDQKLKGNKLPTKVSDSVWGSVRRLEGLKMPKQRR
ncbi:uncharacterized protein KY384_004818 [Bacidia gigantensis]|uniref:uncharacterized protein n=1 Tax=Bacidia gigantensis TaxID=2732470 RepID=UPI001D045029|nr:uncharacterized protein KY384_004818 [Bacidia gigantensis]KAG8530316.1 hypothetical protein KY384_004818 [Bacidia gigantensis]